MDKFMDNPWFLRFIALFLAIILFFSVQAEEKKGSKTVGDAMDIIRDVPVEVYYDNENLVVTGVPEAVNMTIEGPTNIVQTTKLLKDFTLRVDLSSLPMGKHTVRIQHENISEKLQVRLDPATITVVIEEKITQSFRVDPELNERLLAEDFNVVKIDVVPSTIEVTGAKSVIESISFVKASITGDKEINKSFERQARVRVLDKDLTKLNVTIVPEQVTVRVEISEYSKDVTIVLKSRGVPITGVTVDAISAEDKTIRLFGSRKALDQIKVFNVDVDVSGVKGQEIMVIDMKKPKGVSKMSLDKIKVNVDAAVTDPELEVLNPEPPIEEVKVATKEFKDMPVTVTGLDESLTSSFLVPAAGLVVLTVTADQDLIDTLEKSDFTVYVDASETTDEGEQSFSVMVEGPPEVKWILSDKEVTMHIELA
jgi:YbbR domain-containing protein